MTPFSEDDLFNKGFIYGVRLSHEGLMPVLDQKATPYELHQTIKQLSQSKHSLSVLMDEAIRLLEQAVMRKKMKEENGGINEDGDI
ncbi:hypothetical protein Cva_00836 [Caedimonas varicaedens]|uniref:Uncharacterized protein n=1 Tax=Caedimonas varicaedens TaxID=1629334 RepID=A0A0K8MD94_9PROT|nr:hypothetical protein Cva_00836 [Caedimonas varicaedens]